MNYHNIFNIYIFTFYKVAIINGMAIKSTNTPVDNCMFQHSIQWGEREREDNFKQCTFTVKIGVCTNHIIELSNCVFMEEM